MCTWMGSVKGLLVWGPLQVVLGMFWEMEDRILSLSAPIWTSRPRFVFLVVKFPSQGAISFMKALFLLGSKFGFIVLNKSCGSHWMRMDGYYLLPLKLHLCLPDEDYPVLWILSSANKWSKQPCGAAVQAPQTLASKWITLIDKWILNIFLWQHWTDSERGNCRVHMHLWFIPMEPGVRRLQLEVLLGYP